MSQDPYWARDDGGELTHIHTVSDFTIYPVAASSSTKLDSILLHELLVHLIYPYTKCI